MGVWEGAPLPRHLQPQSGDLPPTAGKSLSVGRRAWALALHSQLCDVLGDPLGQSLQVLVAAADYGVEAGALLWALGAGDADGLLLTCTGHREPQSHHSPALTHWIRLDLMPRAHTGLLSSHADTSPRPQSRVLQAALLWATTSAWLRTSSAGTSLAPRNLLIHQDECN